MSSSVINSLPANVRMPALAKTFLSLLERLQSGQLDIITPEGVELSFKGKAAGTNAILHIHDWSGVVAILRSGDPAALAKQAGHRRVEQKTHPTGAQSLFQALAHLEAIRRTFARRVNGTGEAGRVVGQCRLQRHTLRRCQCLLHAAQRSLQRHLLAPLCHQLLITDLLIVQASAQGTLRHGKFSGNFFDIRGSSFAAA